MRAWQAISLILVLAAAESTPPASAQVPRDPLAGSAPLNSGAAAPAATLNRQLPAPFVTRQSDVEVPFTVRPGATPETEPTAVRVFVSWDQGKSWHFYDERKPQDGRFRFRPRQDGEFWFATQTIDRSGKPDSPEPRFPQLRMIVDTQRPQFLVQAQVDHSGNVIVGYSATDASLVPSSLKIEYQEAGPAGGGGAWQRVEPQLAGGADGKQAKGQTTFHPAVAGRAINLRAEVADAAGNIAYFSQRLLLQPTAPGNAVSQGPAPDPSATRWSVPGAPEATAERKLAAATSVTTTPTAPYFEDNGQPLVPNLMSNPFVGPGRLTSSGQTGGSSGLAAESLPLPANQSAPEPLVPQVAIPGDPLPERAGSVGGGQFQPRLDLPLPPAGDISPVPADSMPAAQPAESVNTPSGQQPRLTNSKRFSLDYDVQSVGPEGLAAVELWGTTDGGRTWIKWGTDPDKTSPFDVEVNHEANYGFRIVIVGKNGLATGAPQPGESADIWVGIDLTRPAARLTGAAYGQGDAAGKLDIRWQAADSNLGTRPITLSIGDRPDGPFMPVAVGLPNTGQYFWEYDPRSPRQIFLRLEVRDDAGNIAIDQLTEPIKVEGLEPKGRIRDFRAGPETSHSPFRSPLFR